MTGALAPAVRKELRALAPVWALGMIAVGAGALAAPPFAAQLTWSACGLGSIALGAWSVGQEYVHRTLPLLLTQPAPRARMFGTKLTVLAVLLVLLNAAGLVAGGPPMNAWLPGAALALACGFCLAPALTMMSRSALAGVVFTIVVPALLWLGAEVVGVNRYGDGSALIDALKVTVLVRGMVAAAVVGGAASWLLFLRLEVADGRGRELRLPSLDSAGGVDADESAERPHGPVWPLMQKEVRLQSLSLTIAGLYLGLTSLVYLLRPLVPALEALSFETLGACYFALLTGLVGSLASAEERQLGTRDWQILQPFAWRTQWTVKVATVFAIGILAAAVPLVLSGNFSGPALSMGGTLVVAALAVVAVTSVSLYVSSLCSSGLQAFLVLLPTAFVLGATRIAALLLFEAARRTVPFLSHPSWISGATAETLTWPTIVASVLIFSTLCLLFASRNHVSDRPLARARVQVPVLLLVLTLGNAAVAWLGYVHRLR